MILLISKIVALFFAIWFTSVNIAILTKKAGNIPNTNFIIMAASITWLVITKWWI